jgi:hypothetical protein
MLPAQEILLMHSIREKFFADIQEATEGTLISPDFLAALIANETGGNPTKKRFEKNVLCQLWEVLTGRRTAFGSISRLDLIAKVIAEAQAQPQHAWPGATISAIDSLATSWGLTQIMGYQSIALNFSVADLQIPGESLHQTQRMLAQFAAEFKLNPQADYAQLFHCWNTGRAAATTMDPAYTENGLARMQIYRDLPPLAPQAISA